MRNPDEVPVKDASNSVNCPYWMQSVLLGVDALKSGERRRCLIFCSNWLEVSCHDQRPSRDPEVALARESCRAVVGFLCRPPLFQGFLPVQRMCCTASMELA